MDKNEPLNASDDINEYLNNITAEIERDSNFCKEHMHFIGKRLVAFILDDPTAIDESDLSILHTALYQAVCLSYATPFDDPLEEIEDSAKAYFYTLRNSIVAAIEDTNKTLRKSDTLEQLKAITYLIENRQCTEEQKVSALNFIYSIIKSLAKEIDPSKA